MRRAGRPVIPARRPARLAAAVCVAVAAAAVLSGTAPGGTALTGTARASTARPSTGLAGTLRTSTGPAGPAGARPVPLGGARLAGRGVIVNYPAHGGRRLPHVPASAYVIADAGTGQVLAAKDPHGWYRPASTLKVLTAITLMQALRPDATVIASHRAAVVEPSKVGLITGDRYRVSDLFKALLMISANDAAIALVQATGSYAKGMAMMNAEAHHLRADDTVAVTPNGLDARGQHVSAYDEALFARQALAIPAFMHDESLRKFRFPLRAHWRRHHPRWVTLWTQNTMLWNFRGDLGGKIGWTTPARATFIGWARRGHTTLVVTILHCTPLAELTVASRLLSWGFAMDGRVRPVGHLVRPLPAVTAHPRIALSPAVRLKRPLPAGFRLPTVPLAVGLATLLLAAIAGAVIMIIGGRRRAGNPPGR
ncbi:MAG TPA: D-alanyl-D-alanine carboxypeptidase [Streptosporangiaceae bacterium]|nr:D-alanyl-D-alanine carboxypeptidase [Streptosporangiaceae bacterium]